MPPGLSVPFLIDVRESLTQISYRRKDIYSEGFVKTVVWIGVHCKYGLLPFLDHVADGNTCEGGFSCAAFSGKGDYVCHISYT